VYLAEIGFLRVLLSLLWFPHNTYRRWPAARLLVVRTGAILKKKTNTPSKFIGNSSACAFLRARVRIRVLREAQTRREAGAQSLLGLLELAGRWPGCRTERRGNEELGIYAPQCREP